MERYVASLSHITITDFTDAARSVMPILGGSLPLFQFVEQLGATVITTPMVNAGSSQHAANENLRLLNLWHGIASMADIVTGLGKEWPY